MGGGYFQFFTKNRPKNHQKGAILHTSQANGGAPVHTLSKAFTKVVTFSRVLAVQGWRVNFRFNANLVALKLVTHN